MSYLATWIATAVATCFAIWIVPGITAVGGSWMGPIMFALMLGLVDTFIKPVLQLLSLPLTIMTLGIFNLVTNALVLMIASGLSASVFGAGIRVSSLLSAIVGSIVISIVSSIVGSMLGADEKDDDR